MCLIYGRFQPKRAYRAHSYKARACKARACKARAYSYNEKRVLYLKLDAEGHDFLHTD